VAGEPAAAELQAVLRLSPDYRVMMYAADALGEAAAPALPALDALVVATARLVAMASESAELARWAAGETREQWEFAEDTAQAACIKAVCLLVERAAAAADASFCGRAAAFLVPLVLEPEPAPASVGTVGAAGQVLRRLSGVASGGLLSLCTAPGAAADAALVAAVDELCARPGPAALVTIGLQCRQRLDGREPVPGSLAAASARWTDASEDFRQGASAAGTVMVAQQQEAERTERALAAVAVAAVAPGTWKFVLIDLSLDLTAPGGVPRTVQRQVVRSVAGAKYHRNVFDASMAELRAAVSPRLAGVVVGGGRLEFDAAGKRASVWGYSQSYGRAAGCNQRAAAMVSDSFGGGAAGFAVEWSDEGY
jgi:hypothetical protein